MSFMSRKLWRLKEHPDFFATGRLKFNNIFDASY